MEGQRNGLAAYLDRLQSEGRYVFTRDEGMAALGCSADAFKLAVHRLAMKRRMVSPRRGFHVIVPVEYRSAGGPPPDWYVDALMAFHGKPYYVGILSAAALHGASHQQPQELQVVTSTPLRPILTGRARIRFFQKAGIAEVPVSSVKTYTGFMRVSTPEATAFDLFRYPHASGGLGNVATVLAELSDQMDPARLADAAAQAESASVQRLGYLLDLVGQQALAEPLAAWVDERGARTYLLRPDLEAGGCEFCERWRLVINEKVEADL